VIVLAVDIFADITVILKCTGYRDVIAMKAAGT